jgi:hypothetical protein
MSDNSPRIIRVDNATTLNLTFPNTVVAQTSAVQNFTFQNAGNALGVLYSFSLDSAFPPAPPSGVPCDTISTLNPGSSCAISLTFAPIVVGPKTGALTIQTNMLNAPPDAPFPLSVTLNGTGLIAPTTTPTTSSSSTAASTTHRLRRRTQAQRDFLHPPRRLPAGEMKHCPNPLPKPQRHAPRPGSCHRAAGLRRQIE